MLEINGSKILKLLRAHKNNNTLFCCAIVEHTGKFESYIHYDGFHANGLSFEIFTIGDIFGTVDGWETWIKDEYGKDGEEWEVIYQAKK